MKPKSNPSDQLLFTLQAIMRLDSSVEKFFVEKAMGCAKHEVITCKTIRQVCSGKRATVRGKTLSFFQADIPFVSRVDLKEYPYKRLSNGLRSWIGANSRSHVSEVESEFNKILNLDLQVVSEDVQGLIVSGDYIGRLQDNQLLFYQENGRGADGFWGKLQGCVEELLKGCVFRKIAFLEKGDVFSCSFVEVHRFNKLTQLKFRLVGDAMPPNSPQSSFAKVVGGGMNLHANPSFGLHDFRFSETGFEVDVCWTTDISSLENHDAFLMQAIYAYGTDLQAVKMRSLALRACHVLNSRGKTTNPALGITAVVMFRRDAKDDRYWTFVQLKEGGSSRIPESHLTPSFYHRPATKIKRSLEDEVQDIEFHVFRKLAEEVFNLPEHLHSDYGFYRKIIFNHFAIRPLRECVENKMADLFCHGLIFDAHRSKFELVYVLRVDTPDWFLEVGDKIQENYEAVKGGVVIAPLDAEGVHEMMTGQLTYTKPTRRMCPPGQAGVVAAIEHLQALRNPHMKSVVFC